MKFLVVPLIFVFVFHSVQARSRPLQELVLPIPMEDVLNEVQFDAMVHYSRRCGTNLAKTLSQVCMLPPLLIPARLHRRPETSLTTMCCIKKCSMFEMTKFCPNQQNDVNDLYYEE